MICWRGFRWSGKGKAWRSEAVTGRSKCPLADLRQYGGCSSLPHLPLQGRLQPDRRNGADPKIRVDQSGSSVAAEIGEGASQCREAGGDRITRPRNRAA